MNNTFDSLPSLKEVVGKITEFNEQVSETIRLSRADLEVIDKAVVYLTGKSGVNHTSVIPGSDLGVKVFVRIKFLRCQSALCLLGNDRTRNFLPNPNRPNLRFFCRTEPNFCAYDLRSHQLKLIKMRAELANLNHCAVPFLSCTAVNLSLYNSSPVMK